MYHFVYQTKNIINNKFYIGVHSTSNLNDNYLGSGKYLKRAIKKYGKENFIMTPLQFFKSKDGAYEIEAFFVNKEWIKQKNNYNGTIGGCGGNLYDKTGKNNPNYGKSTPKNTRERISKSVRKAHERGDFRDVDFKCKESTKRKIGLSNRGKKRTVKVKNMMSRKKIGNANAKKKSVKIKNIIYESVLEASRRTGLSATHISRIDEFKQK